MSLMEGFQAAYRLRTGRPFLKQRGVAAWLVVVAALTLVAGSTLVLFGTRAESVMVKALGFGPQAAELKGWVTVLGKVLRYVLAFASIAIAAGLADTLRDRLRHHVAIDPFTVTDPFDGDHSYSVVLDREKPDRVVAMIANKKDSMPRMPWSMMLGEGLEKKESDFAAEVAAAAGL